MWMAGGGFRAGASHGATDEYGYKAAVDPVSLHDLHATILWQLGIDHEKFTYRFGGRDLRLTDVYGHVRKPLLA
jgi:site-specific recombinase XerD